MKNNDLLAFQKKKQKDVILRGTKKVVGAVVNSTALRKKVRKEEKNLLDTDDKSFLIFLKDNKPFILLKPRNPSMTKFFLPKKNFNQAPILKFKAYKP